ncbi:uncharacterized protein LOC144953218 [Lampetra fluviatilis]
MGSKQLASGSSRATISLRMRGRRRRLRNSRITKKTFFCAFAKHFATKNCTKRAGNKGGKILKVFFGGGKRGRGRFAMRLALAALVTASCLAPARAGEGLLPLPEGRPSRGLCRYGLHLDCCYGWRRLPGGHCQPICDVPCKHGVCLGNNKCQCEVGFTGNSCSQDVNECGLKPRPCQYRCMNTPGSFRCYCLNGYLLLRDGSCTNSRTCALANCQNGCEEVGGEVRCLCPSPGLTLGTDMRSCVDINECRSGRAVCPPGRKCVNTFGSFLCKCPDGFGLRYSGGRFQCTDVDECEEEEGAAVPPCSPQAECLNTHGSFRCRCKPGYRGKRTQLHREAVCGGRRHERIPGSAQRYRRNCPAGRGGGGRAGRRRDGRRREDALGQLHHLHHHLHHHRGERSPTHGWRGGRGEGGDQRAGLSRGWRRRRGRL